MKTSLVSSLSYRPKLLIFDEPFTGLDPLVREELIDGMLELIQAEEWTIFISSHDIDEIERLADWIGFIDQGRQQIVEETDLLRNRFRKVEVTLESSNSKSTVPHEDWLQFERKQRELRLAIGRLTREGIGELMRPCLNELIGAESEPVLEHFGVSHASLAKSFELLADD